MKKSAYLLIFPLVFLIVCCSYLRNGKEDKEYFPPPDSQGGWRSLNDASAVRQIAKMDLAKLDEAFDYVRTTTRNGGLLVVRNGYLVYENYFGKGQRDATPNLGSCGKSFTAVSVGMLMQEYPELFPEGLDQKIYTPAHLPPEAFPLPDSRMEDIKLGQLLSFTAGIRGNNPVYNHGEASEINPVGPDGWYGMTDAYALGLKEGTINKIPFTTRSLWCDPGEGYSYATASIHIASIMLRHITGQELQDYIQSHIALPLGWGQWTFAYKYAKEVTHTPGGGGIALRGTDMLRFGYLLLKKGRWKDEQLIPEDFILKATRQSPYNPHFPYSLQFDVNSNGEIPELPTDAFWKTGSGGHSIYVVPSLGLVVWKLGGRDGQYGIGDTGIPEPEPLPDAIPPLMPSENANGNVYSKTLEMVIQAVLKEK